MQYTRHIAGEFKDMKQHCLVCGKELCNYQGAMWPSGQEAPTGFAEGEMFAYEKGWPKMYSSKLPDGDTSENCKP